MKNKTTNLFCVNNEDLIVTQLSNGRSCIWSTQTFEKVKSCPESISEWERRKEIKNCSLLAQTQNCTDASKFEYHCVINENEDALIEVCAAAKFIIGEFSRRKKVIYLFIFTFLTLFVYVITFSLIWVFLIRTIQLHINVHVTINTLIQNIINLKVNHQFYPALHFFLKA